MDCLDESTGHDEYYHKIESPLAHLPLKDSLLNYSPTTFSKASSPLQSPHLHSIQPTCHLAHPLAPRSAEKRRERYLEAVRDKMVKLYAYGEAKPPAREQLWHEITGFLKAGELLGNFTSEELQAIIDEEHITAFGITREERQLKQKLATEDDEQDWDKYDVPPKMR
jgi:hypothetical protein